MDSQDRSSDMDVFTVAPDQPAPVWYSTYRIWIGGFPITDLLRHRYDGPPWHATEAAAREELERFRTTEAHRWVASFPISVRKEASTRCPYCEVTMPIFGSAHVVRRAAARPIKPTAACPACFSREFPGEVA